MSSLEIISFLFTNGLNQSKKIEKITTTHNQNEEDTSFGQWWAC